MRTEYMASGSVTDGELVVRNRRGFDRAMAQFPDCEVVVTIEKRHASRSLAQNRYYFGVVLHEMSKETGHTVEELHEWAKREFLPKTTVILTNQAGEIVGETVIPETSTKRLNKIQFGELIEWVRLWAAEKLGIVIPDPDPDYGWKKLQKEAA